MASRKLYQRIQDGYKYQGLFKKKKGNDNTKTEAKGWNCMVVDA